MTTTDVTTSGVRQIAVLASVAAMLSMAALLFGTAIAGVTTENSGMVIVSIGAVFLAVTLISGWVPGLYLGLLMVVIGSIFVGDRLELARAVILAVTIIVVHETARFSLDARKPTRLGAGLLLRTSLGGAMAVAVVVIVAFIIEPISDTSPGLLWVPLALAAVSLPLFATRTVELITDRVPVPPLASALVGGLVAVVVVAAVAAGAQNREDVTEGSGSNQVADTHTYDDRPEFYPEAVSGSLATLIGMFVAAGILGLLYGAFNRQQILLEQDDIELDLDDSRFAFSLPDRAEIEDVGLNIEATAALLDHLVVDLDNEPDPGRAIRYAYARVEQQMAALGVERAESETAHEFMSRALPVLGGGGSLEQLTDLFERARFSERTVPESMRDSARQALEELRRQIAHAPRPEPDEIDQAGEGTSR